MAEDQRPAIVVMRQFRDLMQLRGQLVRQGIVAADATAEETVAALRRSVPAALFDELPPIKR